MENGPKGRIKLSDFLKSKRNTAGISQGAVAKKLGYSSPQFVSNWERGLAEPPLKTLRKLAEIYNVSADEMFNVVLTSTIQKTTEELKRKFYGRK